MLCSPSYQTMRPDKVQASGCWYHSRPWRPRRLALPVPVGTTSRAGWYTYPRLYSDEYQLLGQ